MAMTLMIQGTMSNVGKSIITAAFCRYFAKEGYRTAPFKAQNMALNSFVTKEGLEIGRAQAMQAEAAGVDASVLMNPILLKPCGDMTSQVILNGEVVCNMTATEYYNRKKEFIPDVEKAYKKLCAENDVVIIEGAGSPVEMNLKKNDIANMGIAKIAASPVLLVGDIDRGGVFAQLLGTLELLEDDEKALVKGLIINKFRGDKDILKSALNMIEERAKKPVVGVIPYTDIDVDDEDSLSEKLSARDRNDLIDIAVIKLPHISNFTDFDPFMRIYGVGLRYVSHADELGNPDLVMVPGTKSTVEDLIFIRNNGIEAKIKKLAANGTPIFGICGGYQMMGERIVDANGEEKCGEYTGMCLLPINTVFRQKKTRTRVKGIFTGIDGIFAHLSGLKFSGYEIHSGVSEVRDGGNSMGVIMKKEGAEKCGLSRKNIYGTYVHGIFDDAEVAEAIVFALLEKKGINSHDIVTFNAKEHKKKQYDMIAKMLEDNLDMKRIIKIMEEGIGV